MELKNDFEISKYDLLDKEQLNFLETFLACEGNLKELQNRMNISYPLGNNRGYVEFEDWYKEELEKQCI